MPFVYFGGKKALARYYPPPAFGTIIEPFAGSAGYALHWATQNHRVILIEKDPAIVALWRRLQAPDAAEDLRAINVVAGERCADSFVATTAGGVGGLQGVYADSFQVTDRMARDWRAARSRLVAAARRVQAWQIIEGDYTDAPNVRATWFVDPPYWVPDDAPGSRGDGYRHGASEIDFDALGAWCKTRPGQVIVCEQAGATWLPFRPLRRMTTAAGDGGRRTEVVWSRTPGKMIATGQSRARTSEAAARRSARFRR